MVTIHSNTIKRSSRSQENSLPNRIRSLKESYLKVRPSIAINRAIAFTEVTRDNPDMPMNLLRGKAFKHACENAPMLIQRQELIIGHPCGKPRAGSFSPDTAWKWMRDELDTIGTRKQDPYYISEADKTVMREELFPFWEGRSINEYCEDAFRQAGLFEFTAEAFVSDLSYHHISGGGDTSPGYDNILFTKGINGIKEEAVTKLKELSNSAADQQQKVYYQGAVETCCGVLSYASRLSAYALEQAKLESDPVRKRELENLAAINASVPAEPPKTFHEGLQAIWTIQSLFLLEENQCSTSLGRFDQYLYPLYKADIESGRLTKEEAFELLCCFILKCAEIIWYTPIDCATYFAGYMPFVNLCVGGQTSKGVDATNELTFLVMDAVAQVKVYQPSLACRIHNDSPHAYLEKIVEVVKAGIGMPACHFDDAHIQMMQHKGFSLEDARDYTLMGCVEPQLSGRMHQWTVGGFTQWPIAIELVFYRGRLKSYDSNIVGLDTGALSAFTTYEEFDAAVKQQIDHILEMTQKGTVINQELVRDMRPTPYMSLFVDGCMQSGKDVTAGGAVLYDGPGTIFAGLGTYVDSMAALKKLVFEDQKYTLLEVKKALDADWKGFSEMHKDCLQAPKYGNDEDFADVIAADIVDFTENNINQRKTLYARMIHGTLSQSFNTPLGELVGATPNGRKSGAPLSDGMSPSHGADTCGPTAIIKSVSKIDVEKMSLGMSHNLKLLQGTLETPEEQEGLITLLKTASKLGNAQMQFNYTDRETLLKAQESPEEYRGLIVRVAGYCAFFTELCKEVQDEIINRTELC